MAGVGHVPAHRHRVHALIQERITDLRKGLSMSGRFLLGKQLLSFLTPPFSGRFFFLVVVCIMFVRNDMSFGKEYILGKTNHFG